MPTNISPKKPIPKTDASKIRALKKQLALRDAEIARLSDENQYLTKEKDQHATELQIINNIGQTLSEGLDLDSTLERVGERLREALQLKTIGVIANDAQTGLVISHYLYLRGKRVIPGRSSFSKNMFGMRFAARVGGGPLVVNTNVEKNWRKFIADVPEWAEIPEAFVIMPLLAGRELVGSITIADYEKEDAFTNLPINMLETIASNMGTAIQNVRLFDQTQRLLKQTEQHATELQVINNIGQTLTEGLDLNIIAKRVVDRLHETLKVENIAITVINANTGEIIIRENFYITHPAFTADRFSLEKFKYLMRLSARGDDRSWVVNKNAEKSWRKFVVNIQEGETAPKSFVALPLLAGGDAIGGIIFANYEKENAFADISISMLETIASNLGTAIQNARLFDETQRLLKEAEQRATELQIINNIGQTLTEGLDLQSTLDRVGDRLREILKVDSIGIAAFDPKSDRVIAQYLFHHGERLIPDQISTEISKFAIRFAARWAGRSWVVNTDAEKYYRKFELVGPPKSFVMLPLLSGKEIIGGISIADYEKENAFTNFPIRMLETISSNMGTAIQNVRLFDETQHLLKETEQRATELQIINNIGQTLTEGLDLNTTLERVGDRLRKSLGVENIGISVWDEKLENIIATYYYRNGKPASSETWQASDVKAALRLSARGGNRSWVINRKAEKGWRKYGGVRESDISKSFVQLPLIAGGKLIGGITIADYEKEDAFTDLPINMLETIASNLGTAIQNARLFDETQRLLEETEQRATELQIINNIGQTLTEGGDLESMIQRVGERLHEALNINNVAISIFDKENERVIAPYMVRNGEQITLTEENFDIQSYKLLIRASARRGGISWVFKDADVEKVWRKCWRGPIADDFPKSVVFLPFLAGSEIIGGISLADYERENAFSDLSVNLLETIASNMGTAIQNVRLFDETQRLLKETEQRATELQIINNIGQTLTEGLDLNSTLERVGERLREVLDVKAIGIVAFDPQASLAISNYIYHYGRRIIPQRFSMSNYKYSMRFALKVGSKPWVVNTDVERYWKKFGTDILTEWTEIPKAFVIVPMLAGRELVGSITIADYENVNAFVNLPLNLLETIASNMGTAIQNVRLFEETKRLFSEAEEARASAEQANKSKSTFLANMSHELRTPLNAIMGFTRIVKKKADGALPEKQIENLDKVLISSEHLLGLINTVLDIAKIEAGRMDVVPSKFSLSTLTDQCATLATPLLKPNVTLEKQADETLGLIFSDQDKIKQIVLNLLSNAAKFTHAGQILLDVQKIDDENVGISVTDSGIGISEEALGRIFEEFQQADTSTTREYGGTGLGLAISRNLARLLGGDLTASSELGKGSTFTLTIPIKYGRKSASSPDAKPDSTESAESKADDGATKPNGRREAVKSILIVEDTEFNIDVLTQLLNDDYNLLIAKDGTQGVNMAQENNPDLILMDISLSGMDGYEATRRIRDAKISVPIIGLSAHAMSGDAEKAKEAGCNDYLTKPVDEILLIKKLNQYLR